MPESSEKCTTAMCGRARVETIVLGLAGYPTDEPCAICGKSPASIEPRFGFAVCATHESTPPVQLGLLIP